MADSRRPLSNLLLLSKFYRLSYEKKNKRQKEMKARKKERQKDRKEDETGKAFVDLA